MKKIERIETILTYDKVAGRVEIDTLIKMYEKLNELVDYMDHIREVVLSTMQTQEHERKHCKKHGLYDCVYGCEKEPECEHEWRPIEADTYRCYKCNKWKEKPAKKECECNRQHFEDACGVLRCSYCNDPIQPPNVKKDELAVRLARVWSSPEGHYFEAVADEARKWHDEEKRKWAVEVVEKWRNEGQSYIEELLARLKESK